MTLGIRSKAMVDRLTRDNGSDATLTRPASKAYDPSTGQYTADGGTASSSDSIKVCFVNYQKDQLGGDIIRGDRRALISTDGLSSTPTNSDQITGVGDPVNIVSVQTLEQSGTVIGYICQVRG